MICAAQVILIADPVISDLCGCVLDNLEVSVPQELPRKPQDLNPGASGPVSFPIGRRLHSCIVHCGRIHTVLSLSDIPEAKIHHRRGWDL